MSSPAPPIIGAEYLGSALATLYFWGIPADANTPPMVAGSFELSGTEGSVTLDVFEGPQGVPGEPSPIVEMQYADDISLVGDLPTNLEDNSIDIGKAWWVGNNVYVWMGTGWYVRQMGVAGPPGATPNITPSIAIVPSGIPGTSLTVPAKIDVSGTQLNPGWLIQFDADSIQGPPGPASLIRGASDYYNVLAPVDGEAIMYSSALGKFYPGQLNMPMPTFYSIPESNFIPTATSWSTALPIATTSIPQQPFAWVPLVWGHVTAAGVDATTNPLTIGAEVLLGPMPGGKRIGRGFGNIANMANIIPHFSTPGATGTAVTPSNGVCMVPAYHTGQQGFITCQLFNDGAIGEFIYTPTNSQLLIICFPVSNYVTAPGS